MLGIVQRKKNGEWRWVGKKRWSAQIGKNSRLFYGKTQQQRLEGGRYRVLLTAADAAGNASAVATVRFRIDRG